MSRFSSSLARRLCSAAAALSLLILAGCSTPNVSTQGQINDPYEAQNRKVHAFNKGLDRAVLRPVGIGYTTVVPDGIEDNINHFADNLSVPSSMINQVLQGDLGGATRNLLRFSINTTLGIGGLADVASDLGLPEDDADFGQTLAVWGVPQGAYVELPVLGPSSERAAAGIVVDFFLNPLRGELYRNARLREPYATYATTGRVAAVVGRRGKFMRTIDGLLYDSVDSYTATRDVYLQNRAFELEQVGVASSDDSDPYADIFGE